MKVLKRIKEKFKLNEVAQFSVTLQFYVSSETKERSNLNQLKLRSNTQFKFQLIEKEYLIKEYLFIKIIALLGITYLIFSYFILFYFRLVS